MSEVNMHRIDSTWASVNTGASYTDIAREIVSGDADEHGCAMPVIEQPPADAPPEVQAAFQRQEELVRRIATNLEQTNNSDSVENAVSFRFGQIWHSIEELWESGDVQYIRAPQNICELVTEPVPAGQEVAPAPAPAVTPTVNLPTTVSGVTSTHSGQLVAGGQITVNLTFTMPGADFTGQTPLPIIAFSQPNTGIEVLTQEIQASVENQQQFTVALTYTIPQSASPGRNTMAFGGTLSFVGSDNAIPFSRSFNYDIPAPRSRDRIRPRQPRDRSAPRRVRRSSGDDALLRAARCLANPTLSICQD